MIDPMASIHSLARIGTGAWVGPGARIGTDAWVRPRAQIGEGAIVGPRARIDEGAIVRPRAQIGEGAIVGPGARSRTRSDGYVFTAVTLPSGESGVSAGCRLLSFPAAREHWARTRGGTPLGAETLEILDFLEGIEVTA